MAPVVRLVELSDLFPPEQFPVKECLHGRSAAAFFALIRPFGVVVLHPDVQIGL